MMYYTLCDQCFDDSHCATVQVPMQKENQSPRGTGFPKVIAGWGVQDEDG